jgi:NAD(P)-dependent dehydrogenase (short-subunit alcohol dehydrogenase family)
MTLTGKHVVLLGGTSGIGLTTAALASQLGAEVTVASSNPDTVKRALETLPPTTTGEVIDLTDNTDVAGLFERIGPLDHLVFTAGESLTMLELRGMDLDRARKAFNLRYFGMLGAVSAAIPHLRPGGSIVLTSGTAGDRPGAGWSIAASICGAIDSLVRAMAVELAPLRVNAVKPGVIRSPLWLNLDEQTRISLYDGTAGSIPLGRVGETEDVAKAYVYLMNQDFATGTVVTVDGGTVLV